MRTDDVESTDPRSDYYQICGGEIQSFTTARCAGDMTPYTTAVVVDLGTMGEYGLRHNLPSDIQNPIPAGDLNTIQRLVAQLEDYEFVVHAGDMAYADYWAKEQITMGSNLSLTDQALAYNVINEAFFDEISPVSSAKAYMVTPGNHEANCINGGFKQYTEAICVAGLTNFTEYKARWNMPGDGSPTNNFWYSFGGSPVLSLHAKGRCLTSFFCRRGNDPLPDVRHRDRFPCAVSRGRRHWRLRGDV